MPFIAQRENRVGASLNRPAYAIRDLVHVDLSGSFDVFMAQDSLGVLHSPVLLEVSAQCATEDLERTELPGNAESICDGPHLPFEKVLGTKRNGIAFVPEVPFCWEHEAIR